jgi:DNA-binding beta-propeller fold protein YncE
MRACTLLSGFILLSGVGSASAQAPRDVTYWQDIRPIFRKHCTVCHSTRYLKKPDVSGGLALDTFEVAMKGTEHAVIRAGKATDSVLVQLITATDAKKRMPLDADPLPKETIDLIRRWIDGGAKEGVKEDVAEVAPSSGPKTPTRKLEVVLATNATPPAGVFGKAAPAKLQLGMNIGPLAPVAAVAFDPAGKRLAVGSYGQVVIWDLDTAKPIKLLTNVLGAVNDLKFSPNGKLLAVAGGQPSAKGDLRLYRVEDWKLLGTLRGHDDVIFAVAFSPDGSRLVSASFDHTLRLWDVDKLASLRSYAHHSDFVYAVAFAPSGKQIASASKDHTVQLVDVETGKSTFTFSGMEQDVMAVAFRPDGSGLVSSGFESAIWWWNPQTGEKVKTQGGHGVAVHELCFSKDGKRLVSAGADRTARTWDGTTGAPLKSLPVGSSVYAVAISPNGKTIATGSFDGLVRLWDESTGRHLATLLGIAGENDQPDWLALTPEGYATGSDRLTALGKWRMGAAEVEAKTIWTALRQPDAIARALRGEAVAAPTFKK